MPRLLRRPCFYILDKNDWPVTASIEEWADWMAANTDRRRVARDEFAGVTVSTVFTGVNMLPDESNLFESVVFGGPLDCRKYHYPTRREAIEGHKMLCVLATIHQPFTE